MPLAPYSIEDPVPGPDGCTLASIFHPQWTLSAFTVEVNSETNTSALSFEIILQTGTRGFQYPISIYQGADEEGWYKCDIGENGNIGQTLFPTSCRFQYEAAAQKLTLDADWECSVLDADHP